MVRSAGTSETASQAHDREIISEVSSSRFSSARRTILDVLDEQFQGQVSPQAVAALGAAEISRLEEAVNSFYGSWSQPRETSEEMRVYSGGWIARNSALETYRYLLTSLLYAPVVVVHDPIAEWFDPARSRLPTFPGIPSRLRRLNLQPIMMVQADEPTLLKGEGYFAADDRVAATHQYLPGALSELLAFAPLIRSGVVVPVPELAVIRRVTAELEAAVQHDVQDDELHELIVRLLADGTPPARSNHIRGLGVTPRGGVARGYEHRAVVQNPSYYLEKTLAIADASRSHYVPPDPGDAALLEYRLRQLGDNLSTKTNRNVELRLIPALVNSELPFFADVEVSTILAIREEEEAFQSWRADLRHAIRQIESLPSEGESFAQEARDILRDTLLPRAAEVSRAVSRSVAMRAATRESVAEFMISGISIGGAAPLLGTEGAILASVTGGLTIALRWAYQVMFRPHLSGTNGVLARLVARS